MERPYNESLSHMESSQLTRNASRLISFQWGVDVSMGEVFQRRFLKNINNHEGRVCKQVEKKEKYLTN